MKKLGLFIGLLSISLFVSACSTQTKNNSSTKNVETLTLGVMPSTDNLPLLVAQQDKLDQKEGVQLKLVPFKSAKDRDAAFQSGKVDGVISDVIALAIYEQAGLNVKVTSTTHDRFDLVANKDIQNVMDLKGKSVVVVKNGGIGYTAEKILAKYNLKPSDVQLVDMPPVPTRIELLKNNKADAAVVPEPFISMSKKMGIHEIASSLDANLNPFIVGFKEEMIQKKKTAIKAMYKAYDDAVKIINESRNDKEKVKTYQALLVKNVGFPKAMQDNIAIDEFPKAKQIDEKDITDAFMWAKDKGLLKKDISASSVLNNEFVK